MRVVIAGATGTVGTALSESLRRDGHVVSRLVRPGQPAGSGDVSWNPNAAIVDVAALEGCDAVVNLSGAGIGDGRWTAERKRVLRSSRIDTTRVLVEALSRLKRKPSVFVSSSAVGFYGNRGDEILTETAGNGNDFLSILARSWEAEAHRAEFLRIRTVIARFGIILTKNAGSLPRMVTPVKLFVGGRYGSGKQWISWITLEDVVGILRAALESPGWSGPVNISTPNPVRNEEFVKVLASVLHRLAILPAPAFALRIILGEMADALLLSSQRAKPQALLSANYSFKYEYLEQALHDILS
jgi:uncharacterized protein (TIGR01777 family)